MRCVLTTCLAVTLCSIFGSDAYVSSDDVCSLVPETGPCRGSFPRFFYNSQTGKCEMFIFGGCGGNQNNFETLEECHGACSAVQNYNLDKCNLEPETGLCKARIPRFFFNKNTGKCETFIYGGCGGNENNFGSLAECENSCQDSSSNEVGLEEDTDVCSQPIKTGMCQAYFPRFAFNQKTGKCERFIYGGCQANKNNFETLEECQTTCPETPVYEEEEETDVCSQPIKRGRCLAYIPRFAFNQETGKCERFVYGGCQANKNNFKTLEECQSTCPETPVYEEEDTDVCSQPLKTGPCEAYFPRFGFNQKTGKCERFVYGGCQANKNNFETLEACQSTCPESPVTEEEVTDVCSQPIKPGRCLAFIPRFAFNQETGKCERFVYGGCEANKNNFETLKECQSTCPETPVYEEEEDTDVCSQPLKSGPCVAYFPRFGFNQKTGKCERFVYGGCQVNKNNFETLEACQSTCPESPVTEEEDVTDVCSQPIKPGRCLAYIPRFAFNQETGKCERFIYGGCQANSNNFPTLEDCQAVCPEL